MVLGVPNSAGMLVSIELRGSGLRSARSHWTPSSSLSVFVACDAPMPRAAGSSKSVMPTGHLQKVV